MNEIRVIDKNRTIEITKKFAKAASYYGTEEYDALQNVRRDHPNYKVVTKSTSKSKDGFKGLTYEYMEKYITKKVEEEKTNSISSDDNEEEKSAAEILIKFYTLWGRDENGKALEFAGYATYGEIKAWFLSIYPEFKQYRNKIDSILGKKAA